MAVAVGARGSGVLVGELGVVVIVTVSVGLLALVGMAVPEMVAVSVIVALGLPVFLLAMGAACTSIVAIGFVVGTIKELAFWSRPWPSRP